MIRITIERITVIEYTEAKSFVTKETPTQFMKRNSYGNDTEPTMEREFETREVPMRRTETDEVLKQEIEFDHEFDLVAVIKAINRIGPEPEIPARRPGVSG